jgi:integrase
MVMFRGKQKDAEQRLRDLCSAAENGTYVEASKITLGKWLADWIDGRKAQIRSGSYVRYKGIIDSAISKAPIATIPVQKLRPSHIEAYYASVQMSPSTITLHHTILYSALRKAVRDRLIPSNPARDLEARPRRSRSKSEDARQHCWTVTEAQTFLDAANAAGPQPAAFYGLALHTGMRKGELCGLMWADVDLDTRKVRVVRSLMTGTLDDNGKPVFGPTKTGRVRTITIDAHTADLLRAHRAAQREAKMAHGPAYTDCGLVFTREDGQPLLINNLGQREYAALIKAAGVKVIKFHGLQHTCAHAAVEGRHAGPCRQRTTRAQQGEHDRWRYTLTSCRTCRRMPPRHSEPCCTAVPRLSCNTCATLTPTPAKSPNFSAVIERCCGSGDSCPKTEARSAEG